MPTTSWKAEDLAYLAGVLDGEGSFVLHVDSRRNKYGSQIQIGNTDLRLLEWVHARFGGSVKFERRHNRAHKPVWRWIAHADNLIDILSAVLPYLVIKRDQAELLLAYRATLPPIIRTHRSTNNTPQHVKDERAQLRNQLSVLNRRGVA